MNKPFKSRIRRGFSDWAAAQVSQHIASGMPLEAFKLDTSAGTLRNEGLAWILDSHQHLTGMTDSIIRGIDSTGAARIWEPAFQKAAAKDIVTVAASTEPVKGPISGSELQAECFIAAEDESSAAESFAESVDDYDSDDEQQALSLDAARNLLKRSHLARMAKENTPSLMQAYKEANPGFESDDDYESGADADA